MTNILQRRHFEVIAGIIYDLPLATREKEDLGEKFAARLSRTNGKFNSEKFIYVCITGKMGKGRSHKNVA